MKKFIAAVFALFLFASTLTAQTIDLSDFRVIDKSETTAYLLDVENISVKQSSVTFRIMSARISSELDNKLKLDPSNYLMIYIKSDCDTHKFSVTRKQGVVGGKEIDSTVEKPVVENAEPDSMLDGVIGVVCRIKVGLAT